MKPSPSHLLIHSVATWADSRGDRVVHLGGGVGGSDDDSLFAFKAGFSRLRHAYMTLRLVVDAARYDELTHERAERTGRSAEELMRSRFFPAYRSGLAAD
jgi:hypothetical protein